MAPLTLFVPKGEKFPPPPPPPPAVQIGCKNNPVYIGLKSEET